MPSSSNGTGKCKASRSRRLHAHLNLIDIYVGLFVDPSPGLMDKIPSGSEHKSLIRAVFHTGGDLSLLLPVSKHMVHFWIFGLELKYSNFGISYGQETMQ